MKYKVLAADIEIICSFNEMGNGMEELELEFFSDLYDNYSPSRKIGQHKLKSSVHRFMKDERNSDDITFIKKIIAEQELLNKEFDVTPLQ